MSTYIISHTAPHPTAPAGVPVTDSLVTAYASNAISWARTLIKRGHTSVAINGTPVEDIPGVL